ncbi:MAG: hypothetical protein Q9199_001632 [Rusavskia elegans]
MSHATPPAWSSSCLNKALAYYNGLLAVTEEMRVQRPEPNLTDGRADKLLDIETEARVLLRSSEIQIGDQYFLDEEVKGTHRRMLQCIGIRLRKPSGEAKDLALQLFALNNVGRGML